MLHVIDVSDPNWPETVKTVESVLDEMDINRSKLIQVFNKIDLEDGWPAKLDYEDETCKVWVSSKTGAGLDLLREAIVAQLYGEVLIKEVVLSVDEAKLRAQLYQLDAVINETLIEEGGWRLVLRINTSEYQRLFKKL